MISILHSVSKWPITTLLVALCWVAEAADHRALAAQSPKDDVTRFIQTGDNFMATQDYGLAITLYRLAKQSDPQSQAARARLGLAYARKGDMAMAEGWAGEVIEEDGCNPIALYALVLVLEKEGQYKRPRELLNWVGNDPKYKGLFFDVAELQKRLDERAKSGKDRGWTGSFLGCSQQRQTPFAAKPVSPNTNTDQELAAKDNNKQKVKENNNQHALPEWAAELWRRKDKGLDHYEPFAAKPTLPDTNNGRAPVVKDDNDQDAGARRITEWWLSQGKEASSGSGQSAETGIKREDTQIGIGPMAKEGDNVLIHYTAKVLNGPTFEKTYPPNAVLVKLGSDQTIRGLSLGIPGMKVGGVRRITIPPAFGFGDKAHGQVPPNATLVYLISLVAVSGSANSTPARAGQSSRRAGGEPEEKTR